MLKGLYTAHTGMLNEQNRMDVLANNLANAATTGYKKEGTTSQAFDDVLAYKIKDESEAANLPRRIGVNTPGVKIGENYTDWSEGSFQETGNTFDLALSGTGFFTVEFKSKGQYNRLMGYDAEAGATSIKYTRDGTFKLDTNGYLVTADGDHVMGTNNQYIRLDPLKTTNIDENGNIYQDDRRIATLRITDFEDYNYLEKYGENYYQPVDGATTKAADTKVYSGYLETSNIQVVEEMVNMITIQRAYESNQKLIQTYDSSLEVAVNQVGKL